MTDTQGPPRPPADGARGPKVDCAGRDGRPLEHDDLWSIPDASDPQISPDGAQVAFVLTVPDRRSDGYRSRIWTVPTAGGRARPLTSGPRDRAPRWSPDGRRLAFLGPRNADDEAQIQVMSSAGDASTPLTDLPGGAAAPVWSPDGSHIAFSAAPHGELGDLDAPVVISRLGYKTDGVGLNPGRREQLHLIDSHPPAGSIAPPRQLTFGETPASSPVWSPDGARLAFSVARGEDRDLAPTSVVCVVPAVGGTPVAVSPATGGFAVADWSPDGDTILLVGRSRPGAGDEHLYALSADGGEPIRLTPSFDRGVDVGRPGYPGGPPRYVGGDRIVFCARDRGAVHVFEVPAGGGEPTRLVCGDRVVSGMSATGEAVAFVAASAESPSELWVRDTTEHRLTDLFHGALPGVRLIKPEVMSVCAPDGTQLHGWVVRDGGRSSAGPLLVDIHGGPHNAWGPAFDSSHLYQQTLAAAGWTVLTLNPRGSDGYGEAFRTAAVGAWGHADESDFLCAVDELVDRGIADPARVCVSGYSYGGYMTCWLTARTRRFAAAVAGGCISDLVSMSGTSDVGHFLATVELAASPDDGPDVLAGSSPLGHVDDVATPTLILHGERDDRCPVGQAEQWFAALRGHGVPVEMVRYPGQSHRFIIDGRPSHRVDYGRRLHAWVMRWTSAAHPAPTVDPGPGREG